MIKEDIEYMDVLFGLAVLPAFLLMIYIRKKDKIEKEPKKLLVSLFLLGALSTVSAVIIGLVAEGFVKEVVDEDSWLYVFIDAFFMVALVEEGGKFVMLKLRTWKNKEFNYTFDAVVYAVCVSLGFATLENILYVMTGSIATAVLRGILSVPGHAINAVFMGYYYGIAKRCEYLGDKSGRTKNLWKSYLSATLIHGFYDFCLMIERDEFIIIFLVFEVIITVITVKKVNKLSREDSPLGPPMGIGFNQYGGYFTQNPYYYDPNGYYMQYSQNMYSQQNTYDPYAGYYQQQGYQQPYGSQQYQGQNNNYGQQGYSYNGYQQQSGYDPYQQGGYNYAPQNNGYSQYNSYYTNSGYQQNNAYQQNNGYDAGYNDQGSYGGYYQSQNSDSLYNYNNYNNYQR